MVINKEWWSLMVIPFFVILVILLLSKKKGILSEQNNLINNRDVNDVKHVCIIWNGSEYIRDETIKLIETQNIKIKEVIQLTLPNKNKLYYELINTTTIPIFSDNDITVIIFSATDKDEYRIKSIWNTLIKSYNNDKKLFYFSITNKDAKNDIKLLSKISTIFNPLRLEEIINWDKQIRKIII